jgi:type I restriction enzyme S subunit
MSALIDYRGKSPRKTSAGIPLITAKIVKDGKILTPEEFIAPEDYEQWMRRGIPKTGDILLTTEAPLGEVAQLDGRRVALAQRLITLRGKPNLLNNTFLKFVLQSDFVQRQLRARATGTTVNGIRQSELRKVQLPLPQIEEQRDIAHILGTLDAKIDLNQRMNETLEAMARAIFKSWFVDFDPVRAKAKGCQPFGMDAEIAARFPDSLEDSPVGKIPEDWTVPKLGDIVEFAYGKALKEENRRHGKVPVYGSNGLVGWHDEAFVKGPGIVVGRKGNPGIVTWVPTEFSPIDTTFYIILKQPLASFHYAFHMLSLLDLPSLGADSAVPGLNRSIACMSQVLLASPELIKIFDSICKPLSVRAYLSNEESSTLAAIRDALLPKLISGEIRVKDAEKLIGEKV